MEETAGTKRDPLKRYISEISNYSLLTVEEEAKLAKQIHGKNEETRRRAMDVLIRSNLRLVVRIAHDFKGAGLPLADLISEGNLGLIRSGSTFNPELGAKFSSYAAWWIKQTMRRAIANQGATIRVPVQTSARMNRIRHARFNLAHELGREPSNLEIAEYTGFTEHAVTSLRRTEPSVFSLQDQIQSGEEGSFEDLIADPDAKVPGSSIGDLDTGELLKESLKRLDPRERQILLLRFCRNKTLDEVSSMIGKTRERVRQIQNQALSKLRTIMKDEGEILTRG